MSHFIWRRIILAFFAALALIQSFGGVTVIDGFEFEFAGSGKGNSAGYASPQMKQFAAPSAGGGAASNFMDDPEDNAGFIGSRLGGASPLGTRRLIQPPPLKKRANSALLVPNHYISDVELIPYNRRAVEPPYANGRYYYFLNRI